MLKYFWIDRGRKPDQFRSCKTTCKNKFGLKWIDLLFFFFFTIFFCSFFRNFFLHFAFEEALQHPDLKVDLGLCAVNLAVQHKRWINWLEKPLNMWTWTIVSLLPLTFNLSRTQTSKNQMQLLSRHLFVTSFSLGLQFF